MMHYVHKSGGWTCNGGAKGYWGCGDQASDKLQLASFYPLMSKIITPQSSVIPNRETEYSITGISTTDSNLILQQSSDYFNAGDMINSK